jgi:hypothetical protein
MASVHYTEKSVVGHFLNPPTFPAEPAGQRLLQVPNVVGNTGLDRWSGAERLVDTAEIVVHVVDGEGRF